MSLKLAAIAFLLVACSGSTPTPLLDASADGPEESQAVVTVVACEVGEPCAVDAGAE